MKYLLVCLAGVVGPSSVYAQEAATSSVATVVAPVQTSSSALRGPDLLPPVHSQVVTGPGTPRPASLHWGPYARIAGLVVNDDSFGLNSPLGALVRMEGGLELAPNSALSGMAYEFGLGVGAQASTSFDRVKSRFALSSLQASALYRSRFAAYFTGYGRATVGLNAAYLNLAPGLLDKGVDQFALGGSIAATLGAELSVPVYFTPQGKAKMAADNYLGFFFEAGYEVHTNLQFDSASRDVDTDTEPARIPGSSERFGDLNLTGWIWRLGGSFRF